MHLPLLLLSLIGAAVSMPQPAQNAAASTSASGSASTSLSSSVSSAGTKSIVDKAKAAATTSLPASLAWETESAYFSGADAGTAIVAPEPVATTVIQNTAIKVAPSEVSASAKKMYTNNKYLWLDQSCGYDKTPAGDYKSDFIIEAMNDAFTIANYAQSGPAAHVLTSDMYIGVDFHKSQYNDEFTSNLKGAAGWSKEQTWPTDTWVRVTCDDLYKACDGKIGNDQRPVTAYANNTQGNFGGTYWRITLCDPFFTLNSIAQIRYQEKNTNPSNLQMIFMESGGEKLLHEMMHLTAVSEQRVKIIDKLFDGGSGKRIYGPRDVAKAARIATQSGDFSLTYNNADTYAIFAQAAYWTSVFRVPSGYIPPVVANAATPAGATEADGVQDSSDNYVYPDIVYTSEPTSVVTLLTKAAAKASGATTAVTTKA